MLTSIGHDVYITTLQLQFSFLKKIVISKFKTQIHEDPREIQQKMK